MNTYITIMVLLAGIGWTLALVCDNINHRIAGVLLTIFCICLVISMNVMKLWDRIDRIESRCAPIEQAGELDAVWESSQPLGGGELIHYE